MLYHVLNYDPILQLGEAIDAAMFNQRPGTYPDSHVLVFKSKWKLNQYQTYSFFNRHSFEKGILTHLELDYNDPNI